MAIVAATTIAFSVAVNDTVAVTGAGEAVLAVAWSVVSIIAGAFAVRSAEWLPDEVVRAHGFPLVLFVGAWYVRLGTNYSVVATGLVAYAAYAMLFRTAALVAGDDHSVARSTAIWYLGSFPAALLVYATRLDPGATGLGVGPVVRIAMSVSGVLGEALFLAVAVPITVSLAHAFWQFLRLVR